MNFDFVILGAHIRWGDSEELRQNELQKLADWVAERQNERFILDKDVILVGDFNVPDVKSKLYEAIVSRGLKMPVALMGLHGSNLEKNKRYDQIPHSPTFTGSFTGKAGVVDFYAGGFGALFPGVKMSKLEGTFQLSDHLPLWIELNTDDDGYKLDQIVNPARGKREKAKRK